MPVKTVYGSWRTFRARFPRQHAWLYGFGAASECRRVFVNWMASKEASESTAAR